MTYSRLLNPDLTNRDECTFETFAKYPGQLGGPCDKRQYSYSDSMRRAQTLYWNAKRSLALEAFGTGRTISDSRPWKRQRREIDQRSVEAYKEISKFINGAVVELEAMRCEFEFEIGRQIYGPKHHAVLARAFDAISDICKEVDEVSFC